MANRRLIVAGLLAVGIVGLAGVGGLAVAQGDRGAEGAGESRDLGAMLMKGLQNTPGCLGVDAGQFMSGKNAIIAWFEDKEAAARWYYSPTHQRAMRMALGEAGENHDHTPLKHVEEGVPVMVIASLTFTDKPEIEGMAMPISQIAIELYTTLPGGAHVNGRFAPASFEVAHLRDFTPPAAED